VTGHHKDDPCPVSCDSATAGHHATRQSLRILYSHVHKVQIVHMTNKR
jgi:hypothetical protein